MKRLEVGQNTTTEPVSLKRARSPVQIARCLKNLANTWRYQSKYLAHTGICTVVSGADKEMLAKN